jgi:hypothetical protein
MVSATIKQIRRATADRIRSLGEPWWLANVPYDLFGIRAVPNGIPAQRGHGAFAVGTPTTPEFGWRQTPRDGTLNRTTLAIRFLARHTPTASLDSVDAATDMEQSLIARLLTMDASWPVSFNLELNSASRSTPAPGDWHLHEIQFTAIHVYPLAPA